eukprot:EG_transcript_29895
MPEGALSPPPLRKAVSKDMFDPGLLKQPGKSGGKFTVQPLSLPGQGTPVHLPNPHRRRNSETRGSPNSRSSPMVVDDVDIPPAGTMIGTSVILEREVPPEPSQAEILEYAAWMGIDAVQHNSLLWIAKEALMATLPPNWRACRDQNGGVYYFNFATGDSLWDHPMDAHYRQLFEQEKQKLQPGSPAAARGDAPADRLAKDRKPKRTGQLDP